MYTHTQKQIIKGKEAINLTMGEFEIGYLAFNVDIGPRKLISRH